MVDQCQDLKDLEKGIPISQFETQMKLRDIEMEYRILTRLNCHKLHYLNLYKRQNIDFKEKNRYGEILPFEHSRVKLSDQKEKKDNFYHYINASYINTSINGEKGKQALIAAMAPKENTIEDFWQMVIENKVGLISMVCKEQENGKEMSLNYFSNSD
mmetsp:Transcript_18730/g.17857  ORF Transcript_18730/g.17857 Transcript_18730/m.17857 type:complete len:157 (+) Transcript_18730:391-861(+)|eukprot:CAMPEP_0170544626 /NCGR_PEP_ID=MMETSP0211-20121228/3313_1 /TAXON_ID=311385 /ORGANISM="Pseudokeronopsis sp., Strain OXSARD2" /LENGTH=156 /DNA_ID=CAMNT_0010848315 /DNA_START=391 /DNA_END=861 /DNA_ORIENTATION=-